MDNEKERLIQRYKDEHRRLVDRERELSFADFVTLLDLKICERTGKS